MPVRDLETIAKIHGKVARLHGRDFFAQLVLALTDALGVDHAMVGELYGPAGRQSRVLAVAWDRAPGTPFVYDLVDTPCETVLAEGDVTLYASGVAARFPKDVALAKRGIDAYVGVPLRARDGAYLGLLVVMHGQALENAEGIASLLRLFAATAGDELERARVAERQELALEAADTASFDWLVEQGSTIWSRNAAAVLGLGATAPPDFAAFVDVLDGASRDAWSSALDALGAGRADELALTVSTANARAISLRARAKRHPDGGLARLSGVASDVTERKALEERLRRAQTLEAQGRLAGSVAHDFNNLLTIVVGAMDLARAKLAEGSPVAPLLDDGRDAALRAIDLSRQLLAFGRPHPTTGATDVALAIRELEPILRRLVGDVAVLDVDAPGACNVAVDRTQLDQLVVNLVINARDAMTARGRVAVSLGVREATPMEVGAEGLKSGAPYAHLRVADSGSGMSDATLAAAFSPYFTTKGEKGTGLGLATCHGIVRGAEGAIWIESALGKGTTVHALLPLA